MSRELDTAVDAYAEVRRRADLLSTTIPEDQQVFNYRLQQPVLAATRSLSPPSRGLRTSTTPPLFSASHLGIVASEGDFDASEAKNYIEPMLSLPAVGVDEEYFGFNAAMEAFQLPKSAQRQRSLTAEDSSLESSTVVAELISVEKTQSDIEQFDDDIDDDSNAAYEAILFEAKNNFRGRKPDFVVTGSKGAHNLVDLDDDQTAEVTFESWDEGKRQGFWVLEDNHGEKHIVKYHKGCYYAWRGEEGGYDDDAIAWPERSRCGQRASTADSARGRFSDDEDFIEEELKPESTRHVLRKKTYTQKHPYAADKKSYAASKQGTVKRQSDIDAEAEEGEADEKEERPKKLKRRAAPSKTPVTPQRAPQTTRKPKHRRSRSTTTNASELPDRESAAFRTHVISRSTLSTRLPGDPSAIPVYLSKCPDVGTLWDKIIESWEADITGTVKSMLIKFPWLGAEYNIKLRKGLTDSYEKMVDEIKDAKMWRDGTDKCTIEIELVVT